MAAKSKTQHTFPGDAAGPAPALADALFKLNAALTYEDFAIAVESFLDSSVPHASRLVMVGLTKISRTRNDCLLRRGSVAAPLPGTHYVGDWELRMQLSEAEREQQFSKPDVKVWSMSQTSHNCLPSYGARSRDDLPRTEWFRRVMEPERWIDNIYVPFFQAGKSHSGFWIKRAEGQPRFSERDMRVLEQYHPWMLAALGRVRALEDVRAHNHDIAVSLFDIPVATFLLDWTMGLLQHNAAAARACVAWELGPARARVLKLPSMTAANVPGEIRKACAELQERWLEDEQNRAVLDFGLVKKMRADSPSARRRVLAHPVHPQLEATVTMLRPSALRLALPSFLVRIVNLDTSVASDGRAGVSGAGDADARRVQALAQLTQAERDVAPLAAQGLSDKEIAMALGKSVPTVKKQLRSIYEKLRVPNRARLMAMMK